MILSNNEEIGKLINKSVFPGTQGGPLMHIIAAKAIALKEALSDDFKVYQGRVINNAKMLATTLSEKGIKLFSGGTDNHLMLIDLRGTGIGGKDLEIMLDKVNITTNKNTIPNDDAASPFNPNGLRVGTPSVTTRGMNENEMIIIGECLADVIKEKEQSLVKVKNRVSELVNRFPLYSNDFVF